MQKLVSKMMLFTPMEKPRKFTENLLEMSVNIKQEEPRDAEGLDCREGREVKLVHLDRGGEMAMVGTVEKVIKVGADNVEDGKIKCKKCNHDAVP